MYSFGTMIWISGVRRVGVDRGREMNAGEESEWFEVMKENGRNYRVTVEKWT